MPTYPTYKLGEIITDAIGGDWGKDPGIQDESYELAYCIRGAEYKNWADDNGSTAVLRKIKCTNLQKRQLKEGDIIVEISGGGPEQPVGRTEVITKKVMSNFKGSKVLCTNFLRLIRPNAELVDSVFLNHYLKFFYSTGEIIKYQAGSNNLRNLKFNDYLTLPIPLPPLTTQQAIVTRIESLFAELDKAVQHLRTAQQQLKTYRQAVLNHWLNNDDGKWEMVKLKDCTKKIFAGGDVPKNNFSEIKTEKYRIPIYANAVKQKGLYGYTDVSRVNEPCVTIAGRGSGTGHTEIREEPFFPIVRLIVIIPSDNLNNSFLKYMVDSKTMAITGSAIPQLTVPTVEEYEFSLPPISDQHRIVQEIESRLSQAEAAEANIAEALQKTEALRQSILKKAFSGELNL